MVSTINNFLKNVECASAVSQTGLKESSGFES